MTDAGGESSGEGATSLATAAGRGQRPPLTTRTVLGWASANAMPLVAVSAALVSAIAIPPDREYAAYFDGRTLLLLGLLLAVVASLRAAGVFDTFAFALLSRVRTQRSATLMLVLTSAFCAALFTNDVALIALLPLATALPGKESSTKSLALVFVLMAAAANLGGMITPFGSPQNLFLFTRFGFSVTEFLVTMAVPFAVSMVLVIPLCLLLPRQPLRGSGSAASVRDVAIDGVTRAPFDGRRPVGLRAGGSWWRKALVLGMFLVTVLVVLHLLPLWATIPVILVLAVLDARAYARMDWGLLVTFVAFFVFAGNCARLPWIDQVIAWLMGGGEMLGSALASQLISNVPAAILFAPFTEDPAGLLVGVNIGGVGTLIASLASLIALAEFRRARPGETRRFLVSFTWINAFLFAVLLLIGLLAY